MQLKMLGDTRVQFQDIKREDNDENDGWQKKKKIYTRTKPPSSPTKKKKKPNFSVTNRKRNLGEKVIF